ncbi:uncharacterized protein LOC128167092 [Crassostrea angulata]|uniref:uncharacterized protein LOC128157454 n=1 Tax=Magallana angulata TaxID=2784310 RepID=UPI0022B2099F|nr:uncharacterized protein LOC128157454 [Crassostrea angulata]XP_052688333.1 uncharacterized protein LOC128166912 [Crassostrea angulata]XP_052688578.1 uncharacterized protein LOC128167092 [Crassostrea angulata]
MAVSSPGYLQAGEHQGQHTLGRWISRDHGSSCGWQNRFGAQSSQHRLEWIPVPRPVQWVVVAAVTFNWYGCEAWVSAVFQSVLQPPVLGSCVSTMPNWTFMVY